MLPKISSFTILVRDMREAQKAYFANRSTEALRKAKALEKKVDDILQQTFARIQQGRLL